MPHAALWVVQPYGIENVSVRRECFNAARGFVGGAASLRKHTKSLHLFQCRTRLCGWCSIMQTEETRFFASFNAARGFVGGAAPIEGATADSQNRFNAARGFVGGAARKNRRSQKGHMRVSMPHAALWVVQPQGS